MDGRSAGSTLHPTNATPSEATTGEPILPGAPLADPTKIRITGEDPQHPEELDRSARDDGEDEPTVPNLERLITDAMALAAAGGSDGPDLADMVNRFWRLVPDEDLDGRTASQMLAAVTAHIDLAQQRRPGQLKLALERSLASAVRAGDRDRTAVLVVTDDMPFLVDSVTAAVTTAGLDIELLAHPQVVVRRAAGGALAQIYAKVDPDDAGPDETVESWMRVEVTALDDAAVTRLRDDLQRVLTDVREAVEDWQPMRAKSLDLADELERAGRTGGNAEVLTLPVPDKDITDSVELLRWLADDNFTFIGYREYRLRADAAGRTVSPTDAGSTPAADEPGAGQASPVEAGPPEQMLEAVPGTGLGILRRDPTGTTTAPAMSPDAVSRLMARRLLTITKANSRSTVHRSSYLDYIGIKTFDAAGNVSGERRFLGLFATTAYRTSVQDLPVVKRKVAEVIDRSGLSERGHSGKRLLAILEDFPRDELFQTATEDLFRTVMGVLRLAGRRQVRVFARPDPYGRFISCLVYLPRDRFTTANRLRIQEILLRELHGTGLDYTTRVNDSTLARLHYIVRTGSDRGARTAEIDTDALSAQVATATRAWDDDFSHALDLRIGGEHARRLFDTYRRALPDTYKDAHTPFEAMQDLAKLELIEEPGQLVVHLYRRHKNDEDVRFKVFRAGAEPMTLSQVLPVLHSLGVAVVDENPYEITLPGKPVRLYDFGLRLPQGEWDVPSLRANVENAFSAAWRGESEVDQFNELVLRAGLTWRDVVVLRAYAKYLRQAGTVYSQEYMEATMSAYPRVAALLVDLFRARLDPRAGDTDRETSSRELTEQVTHHLDAVASLDQDRILRSFLTLVHATLRTSFFQRASDGRPKPYVAFKLDAQSIGDLPAPRPRFEIFVYSPRFEGVHLRFGAVARGGIRWSDRREDFRTEILGLVKAQTVKNAVIVPVGAKGGFVLKQAPPASERRQFEEEGVSCYRQFMASLLDVTDNIVAGQVVAPPDVVRHDADDPYLVVAADKGTAAFSDIANEISASYGFWLGDAFASGGSAGYDHKKMGITARGAWESVRRYLREMNINLAQTELTVVGIGDMSGDVFGNGLLYSDHLRLVAAFDHRHVFVDPDPVVSGSGRAGGAAGSPFVERRRLAALPRSSWDDYDRSLISAGGGVWPRTAKAIPISEQMRRALGIDDDVDSLAPAALIKAILRAPVDLLFNGGIGTYVKATSESHSDVGDKSNDAVRVNGAEVRARIVAEGGNLGLTQAGRIEYALRGGSIDEVGARQAHIATDFIDNSAGVDCSDHEVNIKILLGGAVADGSLSMADRDELLARMTDEVGALVLRDNYEQAETLGAEREEAVSLLPVHRRMITDMERAGHLDRVLDGLPADDVLAARHASATGLTSPELAVLLAHAKITTTRDVQTTTLPDDDWTTAVLEEYFPAPLRQRYSDRMTGHRLRRELVTTSVVNEALNRGGLSFLYRAQEETGGTVADILRAYVVVRDVYDLRAFWGAVQALDGTAPALAQTDLLLQVRRLVDRAVRWLVANRTTIDVTAEITRFRPGVSALLPRLAELFQGRERETLLAHAAGLVAAGLPKDVADWGTRILYSFGLLDVVEVAERAGLDLATEAGQAHLTEVAGVYFVLSDRFRVDDLLSRISALPRQDRWQTMARMALRYDLYAALAELTAVVLAATEASDGADARVDQWEHANEANVARTTQALAALADSSADLAPLSVLLRQIRTLVRTSVMR
ncbi:MAG TPA: NAD-glutamate dehydrogenase [Micromonosporaceae bacterium]|jgi:glutamate dehydrogenase